MEETGSHGIDIRGQSGHGQLLVGCPHSPLSFL
jgi:hypothetical protein